MPEWTFCLAMFSSKKFKEKWISRFENLKTRFPDKNDDVIKNALVKFNGHAGHVVALFSSQKNDDKKTLRRKPESFVHAAEISGKFVFSTNQSSDDTSYAERLKELRKKLGAPSFQLTTSDSKTKWSFALYDDNDSLEEELEIERKYFGRAYSDIYACEMSDVLDAMPIRTVTHLKPWQKYKTELEKLHRMFGGGARGKMAMWDKGKEEGIGFGSVRYEVVMRSKRVIIEWECLK